MPPSCTESNVSWKSSSCSVRRGGTECRKTLAGRWQAVRTVATLFRVDHRSASLSVSFSIFCRPLGTESWLSMCIHRLLSISREEIMGRMRISIEFASIAILVLTLASGAVGSAQETAREAPAQAPEQQRQKADGERHGLPIEALAVAPGTKFLVRLEEELGTKGTKENEKFKVKTLEPLEAGSGIYLPPGAEIHGHVSHVEQAGVAGRAKLWLTFDEIRTKFGRLPIVAEVVSVPGDHSVKPGGTQEGLIE